MAASSTVINRLTIQNFPNNGVHLSGTLQDITITENTLILNGTYGIGGTLGGTFDNVLIENNKIGFESTALSEAGNGSIGIRLQGLINSEVTDNRIAYNGNSGIFLDDSENVVLNPNQIYCNDGSFGIYHKSASNNVLAAPIITDYQNGILTAVSYTHLTLPTICSV